MQLHGFSDASTVVNGRVVYLEFCIHLLLLTLFWKLPK